MRTVRPTPSRRASGALCAGAEEVNLHREWGEGGGLLSGPPLGPWSHRSDAQGHRFTASFYGRLHVPDCVITAAWSPSMEMGRCQACRGAGRGPWAERGIPGASSPPARRIYFLSLHVKTPQHRAIPVHALSSVTVPVAESGERGISGAEQRKQPFSLRLRVADAVLAELGRTPDTAATHGGAECVSASGGWTWSQE